MQSPVLVALDYAEEAAALALAEKLSPDLCRLKVGKELFTRCGPGLVQRLQAMGFEIFLDLKFHDIPTTVAGAVRAAADLGVWMVNVHASGGRRMMEAAVAALEGYPAPPLLIAVTVLTSMSDEDLAELGYQESALQRVQRLAALAANSGVAGVVCSAMEAPALRRERGEDFVLVTPGIRLAGDAAGDQRRVVTPAAARELGADYLVIGRSITASSDPLAALERVHEEWAKGRP
ncbi:orotidine-5'-phosphate decarboxylase [Kineobactrum sediminis]|uniref:Orotidine 5'-phosphate decarboxylase n=1 Tax=Kineobactrum sediminis TaxID=1905677 RepID=A0A2N5Y0Q8_9GAMM|nr:orotidine-5'-phosphate decarboxylase [Kineobactrum sediminis]PLW81982.1 orotidine-5'-phosphate decarboxylase [Kineobactrum sediminis]